MTNVTETQLWPHNKDDQTTWKYVDCIIEGSDGGKKRRVKKYILNPDFRFKHLDPDWPKGNKYERVPVGFKKGEEDAS